MISLYEHLKSKKEKLAVIGLGYVGMPLAVAFSEKVDTIGFDIDAEKIQTYQKGIDPTKEVGDTAIQTCTVDFTSDETRLKEAKCLIVTVPTPVSGNNTPDLTAIVSASEMIGRHLTPGAFVVYESTVYPGATENVCIPILEKTSGLKCGPDFKVGYSPERINPGDQMWKLKQIIKIVSGVDAESTEEIGKIYELVITAGIHKVRSIKTAEACKVVENSQRDVNIAFMNEIAMAFDRMGIDTLDVIEAMNTKWNALAFYPGLVGGHCIGVDPYYFIHEAAKTGSHSQLILSGRRINEEMSTFIGDVTLMQLIRSGKVVKNTKVAVFGLAFKENCPDIRNTKVMDLIDYLGEHDIRPLVIDPEVSPEEAKRECGIDLVSLDDLHNLDCAIFAVAHQSFKEISIEQLDSLFGNYPNEEKVVIDVKSIFDKAEMDHRGYRYWRL